jgi:hypothetical protein
LPQLSALFPCGALLLDRDLPADHDAAPVARLGEDSGIGSQSLMVFRLGAEWFALPTLVLDEIVRRGLSIPAPSAPSGAVGAGQCARELVICVSLAQLLVGAMPVTDGGRLVVRVRTIGVSPSRSMRCATCGFTPPAICAGARHAGAQRHDLYPRPGGVAGHQVGRLDEALSLPRWSGFGMNGIDPSSLSLRDLFRMEAEEQTKVLTDALLALERTLNRPRCWKLHARGPFAERRGADRRSIPR